MIKRIMVLILTMFIAAGCDNLIDQTLKTDTGKEYAIKSDIEDVYRPVYENQGYEWEALSNEIVWKGKTPDALTYIDRLEFQVIIEHQKVRECVLMGFKYLEENDQRTASMKRVSFTEAEADCQKTSYTDAMYGALAEKYQLTPSATASGDASGYDEAYRTGSQIVESITQSMMKGFASNDPGITHDLTITKSTYTHQNNTWPILDVVIETRSDQLQNPKVEFILFLERAQSSQKIVGIIKNIRINGNPENSFSGFNYTMHIMTESGVRQVQLVNGILTEVN